MRFWNSQGSQTHLFSFLSIRRDSESLARQIGKVMGIRRLIAVNLVSWSPVRPRDEMTYVPPP